MRFISVLIGFLLLGWLVISSRILPPLMESNSFAKNPPAVDAAEWLERMDAERFFPNSFGHACADLPDPSHWPEIIEGLEKAEGSQVGVSVFAAMLAGDREMMLERLRTGLRNQNHSDDLMRRAASMVLLYLGEEPQEVERLLGDIPEGECGCCPDETDEELDETPPDENLVGKALAAGMVDEAATLLLKEIDGGLDTSGERLDQLLRLAEVTEDEALMQKGLEKGVRRLETEANALETLGPCVSEALFDFLGERGEWDRIDSIITEHIASKHSNGWRGYRMPNRPGLRTAVMLRGAEGVVAELSGDSPAFSTLVGYLDFLGGKPELALAVVDLYPEKDQGIVLRYVLATMEGRRQDSLYRALLQREGKASAAFFDALAAYDRFQDRPLIWRAELALKEGDLVKARRLVDRAISLDFADEDQEVENRGRAIEFSARLSRAEGNHAGADRLDAMVRAIRKGGVAETHRNVGLYDDAIRLYQEALNECPDLYFLQADLALMLANRGREDEAAAHFEKAFEQMAVSVGQDENYRSDWWLYDSDLACEIAERVFLRMMNEGSENPRLFFNLGWLYHRTGRHEEAYLQFWKALELDPNYMDAARMCSRFLIRHPGRTDDRIALLATLENMDSYVHIPKHFLLRTDLQQVWLDAHRIASTPHPLGLPPFPELTSGDPMADPDQHRGSVSIGIKAPLGFTRDDLLEHNSLLEYLTDMTKYWNVGATGGTRVVKRGSRWW